MHLLEVARIKNYARALSIRSITQLPQALDIYFLPGKKLPARAMLELSQFFGRRMRSLPDKNGIRFVIDEHNRKNITNFATRVLMMAAGDEAATKAVSAKRHKGKEATACQR